MIARLGRPAALLCLMLGPASAQTPAQAPTPLPIEEGRITVLGHATVEVVPDFAAVRIGVSTKAAAAAAALAENSTSVARTIALARGLGIETRDIGTGTISLAQAFRTVRGPAGSEQQPDGYAAQNVVTVKFADLGKLGEFLRGAVDGGANRIDGISFGLNDPGQADREANAAATRDALERAKTIAEVAGVGLGMIEHIAAPPRAEGPVPMARELRAMAAPAPRGRAVPVEAGTLSVSADVEIVWRLKGK